jgi:hypothetical protein
VRAGVWQQWDLTVGRMQAFDVYPLGMGLDLNTYERLGAADPSFTGSPNGFGAVPALYNAEYLFYRPSFPRVGDVALHLYQIPSLRIELLGQFGNTGVENLVGARPAAIFDLGYFKARLAGEYQRQFAENPDPTAENTIQNMGGAGSVQFVLAPYIEGGLNGGYAKIKVVDAHSGGNENTGLSGQRISVGGFVDLVPLPYLLPNLMLGGGANYATFHNNHKINPNDMNSSTEQSSNLQWFAAAQYLFYKQLYVKLVFGYAKSHFENLSTTTPYDDDMFSLRIRLQYLF